MGFQLQRFKIEPAAVEQSQNPRGTCMICLHLNVNKCILHLPNRTNAGALALQLNILHTYLQLFIFPLPFIDHFV